MAAILVVDDEPVVRELLAQALKAPDRHIFLAEDAEAALVQAAQIETLDLALVDKNLPGTSGLKLVRLLREMHPDAAYAIMTAYASVDSAVEALRLGLYDYITKPFDLSALGNVVSGALAKVRLARESRAAGNGGDEAGVEARDVLTGLPTRATFVRQLDAALARFRADPRHGFAVLVADLDDFGRINDSLGHTAGDDLLVGWVRRVAQTVRDDDMVARLGADQLTILLEGV
ncbi:MAG: response regulator, partial [Deltaproteobacteria bacterium]|nr:response regulator [Deltaproteobacteria bacterium]